MNIHQSELQQLQYPIGKYRKPTEYTDAVMQEWTSVIRDFPTIVRGMVQIMSNEQLSTPYREGGWTVRQLVHHLADSHMNATLRFRVALTEDTPVIKPYREEYWATLYDAEFGDIELSLQLLDVLHARWHILLTHLTSEQWVRTYKHPEIAEPIELRDALAMYMWHCNHHAQQIQNLIERMG